jgi:hypothetical protein
MMRHGGFGHGRHFGYRGFGWLYGGLLSALINWPIKERPVDRLALTPAA